MAKLHSTTLGQLLTVLLLLQGAHGDVISVFSSAGGNVTLSCANVLTGYPNCSSTTWIYSNSATTAAVEKVNLGKVKPENTARAERLSLLPNCSLHITDVSTEDAGLYTCQQYPNGRNKHGEDAAIDLSVLQVGVRPTSSSSKSSSTKSTTTTASPNTHSSGVNLTSSSSSVSKAASPNKTVTTVPSTSGPPAPAGTVMAGVGVCVCLVAAVLIVVVVIRKRRTQGRTAAIAMQSVQPPRTSATGQEKAELHYAALQHLNPTQAAKQSEDTVTYSSIMQLSGGEDQSNSRPVDPSAVYATVQKNNKTQN